MLEDDSESPQSELGDYGPLDCMFLQGLMMICGIKTLSLCSIAYRDEQGTRACTSTLESEGGWKAVTLSHSAPLVDNSRKRVVNGSL